MLSLKSNRKINKWVLLTILSLGGGLIYQLPYLRYAFYEPLRQAMNVTDGELGFIASMYGIIAIFGYLPGGYVADKFSARKLIGFSLICTGGLGIWYSTFPSYTSNIIIFSAWGIVTIITYWSAFIKAIGMLSDGEDTSKYYGISDGIRGLTATTLSFLGLYIFRKLGESSIGMKWVILIFSISMIVVGILSWMFIPEEKEVKGGDPIKLKDVFAISKMKVSWLISGIIFTTFGMIALATYMSPYAQTALGASASLAVTLGIIRTHIMQLLGGPAGGILSSKLKSTPKTLIIGYIIALICGMIFVFLPVQKSILMIVIVLTIVQSFMLCAMRGIYFSTINDAGYPEKVTGSAIGFASFIGFLPDALFFTITGGWIDKYGVQGYKLIFISMAVLCIVGVVLSVLFIKEVNKIKQKNVLKYKHG